MASAYVSTPSFTEEGQLLLKSGFSYTNRDNKST